MVLGQGLLNLSLDSALHCRGETLTQCSFCRFRSDLHLIFLVTEYISCDLSGQGVYSIKWTRANFAV